MTIWEALRLYILLPAKYAWYTHSLTHWMKGVCQPVLPVLSKCTEVIKLFKAHRTKNLHFCRFIVIVMTTAASMRIAAFLSLLSAAHASDVSFEQSVAKR